MKPSSVNAPGLKSDAQALAASSGPGTPSAAAPSKTKRRTRRLVWTDDLHLRFVSAVFELGVKNASPKALLDVMEINNPTEGLTTEHIKSHLQKYRINHERARLEVQRLHDKQAKRSLKRHHRHTQHREAGGAKIEGEGVAVGTSGPWTSEVSSVTRPQDTNQQWNLCDALLLEDEASEQHMHLTMQQRMDFHRELLLTRSVEVASDRSWASRMDIADTSGQNDRTAIDTCYSEYPGSGDSSFLQAWVNTEQLRQQEEQVYGRLHQQQQSLFTQQQPDASPVVPFTVRISQPEPPPRAADGSMDTEAGIDLSSWGRLSLTADPDDDDDDDIFGFLRPS